MSEWLIAILVAVLMLSIHLAQYVVQAQDKRNGVISDDIRSIKDFYSMRIGDPLLAGMDLGVALLLQHVGLHWAWVPVSFLGALGITWLFYLGATRDMRIEEDQGFIKVVVNDKTIWVPTNGGVLHLFYFFLQFVIGITGVILVISVVLSRDWDVTTITAIAVGLGVGVIPYSVTALIDLKRGVLTP